VDCRQDLDAKMAKTPDERNRDSFWRGCAEAVQNKDANPEIDEMQVRADEQELALPRSADCSLPVHPSSGHPTADYTSQADGIYYGSVDPSLPDGGCCPALTTDACALKLKAMMKSLSSQVTQAMRNMQQSGEGDLATDIESALDGAGDFPDIHGGAAEGDSAEEGAEHVSGSSPYDFLPVGIASYFYTVLSRESLLLVSTTMLAPAAQCSSSSGSATSYPRRKTPTKTPQTPLTPGNRQAGASAEIEIVELGDTDGDGATLAELATQSRAANLAAQGAADSVKLIAAALSPAMQPTPSANLETEQVADVKAKRFEVCLDELGQLAEGSPFKPIRTRLKAKQVYNAGVSIDMSADDVIAVIAEAAGDRVGDLYDTLLALNPVAAKSVLG